MSIIKALEQPNVEMEELIWQQKTRYESKTLPSFRVPPFSDLKNHFL